MQIQGFRLAAIVLLVALGPAIANAQYSIQQCTSVLNSLSRSFSEGNAKQIIGLERQYLTYCRDIIQPNEYVIHLGSLATGLNADSQHQEAIAVANRCLQISATDLSCLYEKANSLAYLGRLTEAKAIVERALTLGAITEIDAAVKPKLRELLAQLRASIAPGPGTPGGMNENAAS